MVYYIILNENPFNLEGMDEKVLSSVLVYNMII